MTQPESIRVPLRYEGVPIAYVEIRSTGHMRLDMAAPNEFGKRFFEMGLEGLLEGLSIKPIVSPPVVAPTPKISSGYNIKLHNVTGTQLGNNNTQNNSF